MVEGIKMQFSETNSVISRTRYALSARRLDRSQFCPKLYLTPT